MTARSKPRTPAQRIALTEWRFRWETDPDVTFVQIAEAVGVTFAQAAWHAYENKWRRSASVKTEAAMRASARGSAKRWRPRDDSSGAGDYRPPLAASSIFALAAGRLIHTVRQGGKYHEVQA